MANFWDDPSALQPKQQHRWIVSFGKRSIPPWFVKSVDKPSFANKIIQAKYLYSHTFNFPTRVVWNPIKITLYDAYTELKKLSEQAPDLPKYYSNPKISQTLSADEIKRLEIQIKNLKKTSQKKAAKAEEKNLKQGKMLDKIADDEGIKPPAYFSPQLFFYSFLQEAGYFNPEELDLEDKLLRFRDYTFKEKMVNSLLGSDDTDFDESKTPNDTRGFTYFEISELNSNGDPIEAWRIYNPLVSDVSYDKLDYSADNVVTINATIAYDWAELIPISEIKEDKIITDEGTSNKKINQNKEDEQNLNKSFASGSKRDKFISSADKDMITNFETTSLFGILDQNYNKEPFTGPDGFAIARTVQITNLIRQMNKMPDDGKNLIENERVALDIQQKGGNKLSIITDENTTVIVAGKVPNKP